LRGVSKDGPPALVAILRDAAKEAAPQDEENKKIPAASGREVGIKILLVGNQKR
jgi:hypothetical protein